MPTSGTAFYNGNISQIQWKTKSVNPTNNPVSNCYNFSYDALNRIKRAEDNTGHYNLINVAYDKNENITSLYRKGHINTQATAFELMNSSLYSYQPNTNKLVKVRDLNGRTTGFKDGVNSGNDYIYDIDGNLIGDYNKGITSIVYNHLNLPTEVKFNNNSKKITISMMRPIQSNKFINKL